MAALATTGERMRARTLLLALTIAATLALAPAASAATPFTAGTGFGHDLATGSDGTGHVVWLQDESPSDRLHYCRVPAGGSACDGESTILDFGGPTLTANAVGDAQVFTPITNRVVILASCWACGAGSTTDRTYRWISTDNGANFGAPVEIGRNLVMNGQADWVDTSGLSLATEGLGFQATDASLPNPDTATATLASGGLFVYSPAVIYDETLDRAVYATNDLDTVKYAYRVDATPTAAELNNVANWQIDRLLSSPEGDNDETALSSGPSGIFLTYKWFVPNDNRLGLRKFDPVTNTFGGPVYVEGADPIDNNSLDYPYHSQDGSGRIHVVWRTLHDDGRLRYSRSDDGGATFSAGANLALKETFIDPIVEAAPSGAGFAAWKGIGSGSAIRVVPIDPQPEPAAAPGGGTPGGSGPDTTPPTAGGLTVGDATLLPGQGTGFSFTSSEAGQAVLTVQKQVPGLRMRIRGRLRCVPQTRRRLRALRRQAGSDAAFRRLLRRRRCTAYKRIGSIRQTVVPGRNTIIFNGRIAGRRLRPGRYRALLKITDSAGNVSRVERIRFRVLRPRRR
jgi:hypothetical protein